MDKSMSNGTSMRVPIPDPTLLTTQALLREVEALQELIDLRIEGEKNVNDEKFRRVEQQFELVERQRVEQKKDTKDAVDAALTAQKEAVKEQTTASERAIAKSEAATTKQLEQLGNTFTANVEGLRRTLDEIKERGVEMERQLSTRISLLDTKVTAPEQRGEGAKALWGYVVGAIGLLATILAIMSFLIHK